MFDPVNAKISFPEIEHKILEFWERENIFKKSIERRKKRKKYVFFDGPPFANGLPHYGHILANALKDAVTRYWTMQGYYVPRRNGWDCHGLPVEYEVEKELKVSGKTEIEKFGIAQFNQKCRESVFRYTYEWEALLKRIARFVDFDDSYATLDNSYIESIWWVFKEIWKKKMIYQGHTSMHICPRCVTPLSNFEVGLGYKEITDLTVTAKFELKDEKNTFILAWTTTPWTLPGNAALAFGSHITYVKVSVGKEKYILAEKLIPQFFEKKPDKIEKISLHNLLGQRYLPLFPYFGGKKTAHETTPELENRENAWKIIVEDFVSTEEGTGVVHIAPGFGEEDYNAGKRHKLPLILHVNMDGTFTNEVKDFAGKFVKGQDLNIAQYLDEKHLLFKKENYRHSYPHCWRCETQLINYATKAWFISVRQIKNKLLKNNQKIHWQPDHIKKGRFGKWLENVKDWNISRSRYWGAPIPIWQCECGNQKCVGSMNELSQNHTNGVRVLIMRHGEFIGNVKHFLNAENNKNYGLTEKGRKQAAKSAKKLVGEKIDIIYTSPLKRAKETADIISNTINTKVIIEERLTERKWRQAEGMNFHKYIAHFNSIEDVLDGKQFNNETLLEVKKRVGSFVKEIVKKHPCETVLIVSHGDPLLAFEAAAGRLSDKQLGIKTMRDEIMKNCEMKELFIGNQPENEHGECDIHKPYIDDIELECEQCGKLMKRIPEVLDCWFESGAMPYAQLHYPFENKDDFELNFPADFIAEGLDQTRGWFYTLHVLATILFDSPAFKNVIVNGILLAANGEKLSKRKKNYPDPTKLFETKGVDSTRFFLYSSTAPLASDVRFSETHVEEMIKKFTLTLWNTYNFFITYASIDKWKPHAKKLRPKHKLDQWILCELHILIKNVTESMNEYNLTKATRPMLEFIDNVSNWYVRRSRRRFWKSKNDKDKSEAYQTLYEVLTTFSKLLCPFMPFLSEEMYKNLTEETSVHLTEWPEGDKKLITLKLHNEIKITRKIVALGHSLRAKRNIKVRQPLHEITIGLPRDINPQILREQKQVILEELNVKQLHVAKNILVHVRQVGRPNPKLIGPKYGQDVQKILQSCKEGEFELLKNGKVKIYVPSSQEKSWILEPDEIEIGYEAEPGFDVASEEGIVVILDTMITPDLRREGYARDLIRYIQELRKKTGYQVSDRIYTWIEASGEIEKAVTQFADYIKQETLSIEIQQKGEFIWDKEELFSIEGQSIKVAVRKFTFKG